MSRFAKLVEEELKRRKELKTDNEKNYQFETFFLYILIKFHTWDDSGICKKPITEIIEIWNLDYDNSMRRYKLLRVKKWIEIIPRKDGDWIRPLVAVKTVKSTVENDAQTVDFTVEKGSKTVKSTVNNCKVYSKRGVKTVKSTVAFKGSIEPLKSAEFSSEPSETKIVSDTTTTTTTEPNVVVGNGNHKSRFSFEDCVRYVQLCERQGQTIKNPTGLATYLYESGEKDIFIAATLYPEPVETQTIEYDDGEAPGEPQPLDEYGLYDARDLLKSAAANNENLTEYRHFYTEEDWQWLMERVK